MHQFDTLHSILFAAFFRCSLCDSGPERKRGLWWFLSACQRVLLRWCCVVEGVERVRVEQEVIPPVCSAAAPCEVQSIDSLRAVLACTMPGMEHLVGRPPAAVPFVALLTVGDVGEISRALRPTGPLPSAVHKSRMHNDY